jgi:tetratricopeptide (TPR) repeat protein
MADAPEARAAAALGWDVKALRMVNAIERSIVRLHLNSQGEFVAILNAIVMQLESGHPVPVVVDHLAYALLALAQHHGVDSDRLRLPEKLQALTQRVAGGPAPWTRKGRMMTKLGRNEPCPCGSGQKYKRCCLPKHEAERAVAAQAAAQRAPAVAWDDDGLDEASNRVVDLIDAGKLDEAEQAARALLVRYPDVHDGFERLAMVYEARGAREQAAEYYQRALAFMRENADGYDPEVIAWMRQKAESWSRVAEGAQRPDHQRS